MNRIVLFAILVWMIASTPSHAQQPQQPADKDLLPPPKEIPSVPSMPTVPYVVPIYIYDPPPRLGQRNAWELYSVNSRGQFVPRRTPAAETHVPYASKSYYFVPSGQAVPLPMPAPLTSPPRMLPPE